MKRKGLLISLVFSLLPLTGCSFDSIYKFTLDAPVAYAKDTTIIWDDVEKAVNYKIYDNDSGELLATTSRNTYDFPDIITDINVYVTASYNIDDFRFKDSQKSNIVTLGRPYLNAPEVIIDGTYMSWKPVDWAETYKIYNETTDAFIAETTDCEYTFTGYIKDFDVYVIASYNHSDLSLKSSSKSNVVTVVSYPTLVAPSISIDGTLISWESVQGADKYIIYNADTDEKIAETTNLSYQFENITEEFNVYVVSAYNHIDLASKTSEKSLIGTIKRDILTVDISNMSTGYNIGSYVKDITFTGTNSNFSISISSRTSPLNITLDNVDMTINEVYDNGIYSHDPENDTSKITLNIIGTSYIRSSTISGSNDYQSNCAGILINNLDIIGNDDSKLYVYGSNAVEFIGNNEYPVNGAAGIAAETLYIGVDVYAKGGNGSGGYAYAMNTNGGNGGDAIRAKDLTIECATIEAIGGNGGKGNFGVTSGLNGGVGGNGGHAIYANKSLTLNQEITLKATAGAGGNGGSGSLGYHGGNGSDASAGTFEVESGGDASDGGRGGDGGAGGYAGYALYVVGDFTNSDLVKDDSYFIGAKSGNGGNGGTGGNGGEGGDADRGSMNWFGDADGGDGGDGGRGGNGGITHYVPAVFTSEDVELPNVTNPEHSSYGNGGNGGTGGKGGSSVGSGSSSSGRGGTGGNSGNGNLGSSSSDRNGGAGAQA